MDTAETYGTQDDEKQNKNTTQYQCMCWTPLCARKHK